MLRCLADPLMKLRVEGDDYLILFKSEVLGHIERLLMEMYSGNQRIAPKTIWECFGVVDGIYERSWPSFDPEYVEFVKHELNLHMWLRDKEDELLFVQAAAVRYHFSVKVWGLQRALLEGVFRRHVFAGSTKAIALKHGESVIEMMYREWTNVVRGRLELEVERARSRMNANGGNVDSERKAGLLEAVRLVREDGGLLNHMHDTFLTLAHGRRVLTRIYSGIEETPIPCVDRSIDSVSLASALLAVGKGKAPGSIKLYDTKMTWPTLLQRAYEEARLVKMRDETWLNMLDAKVNALGVEYIMSSRGGRLDPTKFQRVERADPDHHLQFMGGTDGPTRGVGMLDVMSKRRGTMERLFGKEQLPVIGMPDLVKRGFQASLDGPNVMEERKAGLEYLFRVCPSQRPLIRLIYTMVVILTAHPQVVRIEQDVNSKVWALPPSDRKHRTDHARWAVALAAHGIYHSGYVAQEEIKWKAIEKGFTGTAAGLRVSTGLMDRSLQCGVWNMAQTRIDYATSSSAHKSQS
jgi:hypothetical protein